MAPSTTIKLRNETISAIRNDTGEGDDLLLEDIESSEDDVIDLLKNYEQEKDPRGQVYTIDEIESVEINKDGRGGFWAYFPVNVYSGCRDIDEDFDEEKYISIEVDFNTGLATLTGDELLPERDPDSY
nr:hypothetical protein [Nitrosomonas nitrosa]